MDMQFGWGGGNGTYYGFFMFNFSRNVWIVHEINTNGLEIKLLVVLGKIFGSMKGLPRI
jgi:hypothetical protein